MSLEFDADGKLVNMIMQANSDYRFAGICDGDGNILYSSSRNNVEKMIPLAETRKWLKRSAAAWKERESVSDMVGKGKFAYVGYEKIRHITVPLKNGHILFITLGGKSFPYLGDIMKIVKYAEEHEQ